MDGSASTTPATPRFPLWKKVLISFLLVFHAFAIRIGSNLTMNPRPPELYMALENYVIITKLWQRWALFSPEPRRFGLRYHAVLTYKDGKQRTWTRPRAPNWHFFGRHLAYNFQKWDLVANNLDQPMLLWPGLVGYLERAYRDDFNPLVKIEFFREHTDWPPPNPEGWVGPDMSKQEWKKNILFTYWIANKQWDYREYSEF